MKRVRVLIVDDSALVRKILEDGLGADPELEVIGSARHPYQARELMVRERPDVITLDLEMPRMDGLSFLRRYMKLLPTPTVVLSSLGRAGREASLDALLAGAVDVIQKPAGVLDGLPQAMPELCRRIKAAARSNRKALASAGRRGQAAEVRAGARAGRVPRPSAPAKGPPATSVLLLGASTGGVEALGRILPELPPGLPPLLVTQHMPDGFTADFARRMDALCQVHVAEAADCELLTQGCVRIAPGGEQNLILERRGETLRTRLVPGDPAAHHHPSIDALFSSAARACAGRGAAVLLTGMGRDGAAGLLALRQAGAATAAQDEATSTVYGMPKAAAGLGACQVQLGLDRVAAWLVDQAATLSRGGPR